MLKVLLEAISQRLEITISSSKSVSGGDINQAYQLVSSLGLKYFVKYNTGPNHNDIIKAEKRGLDFLESHHISVPRIQCFIESSGYTALILEWIELINGNKRTTEDFCENLVSLHSKFALNYGLNHHNYIGRLPQSNENYERFEDFYIHMRIEPQLKMAAKAKYIDNIYSTERLKEIVASLVPKEQPTLIHGDLWNGNYMMSPDKSYLIDPSISYCHREMDIAMMSLFGGFDRRVFELYNERLPLEKGYEERMDIFQLYYLLVHLNMFGESYLGQVMRIINKYY